MTTATLPSLVIVDDDRVVAATLAEQLGEQFDIVGFGQDADDAAALAAAHAPDVALIDVDMPGGGVRAARAMSRSGSPTAVVALSADESRDGVLAMLAAGAVTYLRKGLPGHELAAVLHRSLAARDRLGDDA